MRARLPAYGFALVAQRNRGQHPDRVWVLVGDDWSRRPVNAPTLCVKAGEDPAGFDWSICAGLPVHVVDRGGDVAGIAVELARYAAPVTIHWIYGEGDWPALPESKGQADVSLVMWSLRERSRHGFRFTRGWSDDLHADYAARRAAYIKALLSDCGRILDEIEAA